MEIPRLGAINLHAGKVPEYRGGSPLNWQIINNEEYAGLSILYLQSGIDCGDVLATTSLPIQATDTIVSLHQKANELFPGLVLGVLRKFDQGHFEATPQSQDGACYWHQRTDLDGKLNPREMTAAKVNNVVRALTRPYPGAWAFCEDEVIRIFSVSIPSTDLRGTPGRVCFVSGRGPYLICKDKSLLLEDYVMSGGKGSRLQNGMFLS